MPNRQNKENAVERENKCWASHSGLTKLLTVLATEL